MSPYTGLEIAVIGMAGRFPGAADVQQFWENLKNGVESISFFTEEELLREGVDAGTIHDNSYVKAFGLLEDKDYFDSAFFNYTPNEATLMDPQVRIFHECVWEALESAGCDLRDDRNKIGVFAGASMNVNWELYAKLVNAAGLADDYTASQLSNARFAASRISYALNLRGPAIFVDTTCSTSLTAIHEACGSLLLGNCNIAVAGGVGITGRSKTGYHYVEGMIFSPDGHCRAFDRDAGGTLGGEGAGVVILKTLKNAMKDRDNILAVIKGRGINNDGSGKSGYTAPSVDGQTEAVIMAHKWAKVEPESIGYIEAHGTGTKLGDPIEVEALIRAFGRSPNKYCALGSVKTNIGHLDVAAGIAGFIKTVLALKNRQIPPCLHFNSPNPNINFSDGPFYVNTMLKEWNQEEHPLRAGVSSFGIGGTNVHIILEEAPSQDAASPSRDHQLLLFSAKTPTALERNINRFREYLTTDNEAKLADIAFTLQTGRQPQAYRRAIICTGRAEAAEILSAGEFIKESAPISGKDKPFVVFMFPGQGSQYRKMCYDLYKKEAAFRDEAEKCFDIVRRLSGKDLRPLIFTEHEAGNKNEIDETELTQPALFIIEYALARLLLNWGIQPDIMIGHSIGEYVAACLSGVFTLEDALYLVVRRGELMQKAPRGIMMGISISENALNPLLTDSGKVSLAAVNSSELCVVSGEEETVNRFRAVMEENEYRCGIVRTSHAFHSHMMDGILEEFEKALQSVRIAPPRMQFISNVSGVQAKSGEISDPKYWVEHLRRTVQFSKGLETILEKKKAVFIEVGPGRTLGTFVRSHRLKADGHQVINIVRQAREPGNDLRYLLAGIGELWVNGIEPRWKYFYDAEIRRRVALPTYSFEKTKYPARVDAFKMISERLSDPSWTKEADISSWFYTPTWKLSPLPADDLTTRTAKNTLIFAGNDALTAALIVRYRSREQNIICVRAGDCFRKLFPGEYEVNPSRTEDYKALFTDLSACRCLPDRIIHGWGITAAAETDFSRGGCELYFHSFLKMVSACGLVAGTMGRWFTVLTSDLHPVLDTTYISGVKSLSLALLKVLGQEYPSARTLHVDISSSDVESQSMAADLYREMNTEQTGTTISFRHGRRWERIYEKVAVEDNPGQPLLKEEGVYLITGGLGALGFHLSGHLIQTYKARLFLVGRTRLPAADSWNEFLGQKDADENIKEKIKKLQQLQQQGGRVLYYNGDIADVQDMERIIKMSESAFGPINGVIHAAGTVPGSTLTTLSGLTEEDFEKQFSPKIKGLQVLNEALAEKQLDFCLLVSSLSTVLGGIGFGAYAPANIFMDYYIQSYRSRGRLKNWMSVCLDGFDPEQKETRQINKSEVWDVFKGALSLKHLPVVVISTTDLRSLLDKWVYRQEAKEPEPVLHPYGSIEPVPDNSDAGSNQPAHTTEEKLKGIWEDFLGRTGIGLRDDFFEIGGDSLKALAMISRVQKLLKAEVSIREFFSRPTIRELAAYLDYEKNETGQRSGYDPITKAGSSPYYPLTSAQKRLYFLYELDRTTLVYNLPMIIRMQGVPDKEKISRVFGQLIQRHETLRTSFVIKDGEPVQKIDDQVDFKMEWLRAPEGGIADVIQAFIKPFDISLGAPVRVALAEVSPLDYYLLVDMHHIITDGSSMGVFIKDFNQLYEGRQPQSLSLQYKDYAVWQQSQAQKETIARQKEFWLKEFSEIPEPIEIPTDFSRPKIKSYEGAVLRFQLSEQDCGRLKSIAASEGASMFMISLSIYTIFLSKLSNQEDVVIGINSTGRQHPDLENMMGMFATTLPLRNFPREDLPFREFLFEVKERTLACFDNQDYPFDRLIEELKIAPDLSRNPLFEMMLSYLNLGNPRLVIPGLEITLYSAEQVKSKFDCSLVVVEADGQLFLTFEYATALFRAATIENFIDQFRKIVATVAADPGILISAI